MRAKPPPFHAFVTRGKDKGEIVFPHRHEDGLYVVSKTRFERDYIRVQANDILEYLLKGYGLRMSNSVTGIVGPRLFKPQSIYAPVAS